MCSQITTVGIDWKTLSFEKSHTFDGYVFATTGEKCWYISLFLRDRPHWLREHPDRCRRIADVRQEAAPPAPPLESDIDLGAEPAGSNCQTSSRGVQDNGGQDDIALVDTLAGDRSPPLEPTLPIPETTTVENGGVTVAANETKEPKTETTPLGAMGRKRGRRRSRQDSLEESLRIVVDSLRECPILSVAAAKAGIHRKTLEYRLKRSEAGDDGYNFEWQGVYWSFHEHCQSAMQEAYDRVLAVAWYIAMGDLTDENGKPVPQASWKQRGKMLRFLLEWHFLERWGKHRKIDIPHNTGVLVVGGISRDIPNKVNKGTAASVKARKWKAGLRMIKETEV